MQSYECTEKRESESYLSSFFIVFDDESVKLNWTVAESVLSVIVGLVMKSREVVCFFKD